MKRSVLEYLYEAADVCSEKIALEDTEQAITYGRLLLMVKAAGTFFARLGAGKRPVIVLSQRSADCIAAFLGVAASGNFYVPVDTAIPSGRFRSILDTLNPVCVTGRESCRDIAEKTGQDIPFYSFEEVFAADADEKLLKGIRAAQIDTDPLYAIFTSGSTGMPKGVLVSHRSVIDLAEQFTAVFGFGGDEVFANQAPFDFDVSVKDLYLSLRNKGTLLVVPQTLFIRPKEIVPFLREKGVTVLIWAASALQLLHNFSALDKEAPDTVRQVMFSGEVLPVKVLHYWQEHLPQARFVNLYGPTEITCNCTYYIVDRAFADTEILPVGKPFPNTEILLLDKEGAPVPRGEIGEICVRGSSLALGYYRIRKPPRRRSVRTHATADTRSCCILQVIWENTTSWENWSLCLGQIPRLNIWAIGLNWERLRLCLILSRIFGNAAVFITKKRSTLCCFTRRRRPATRRSGRSFLSISRSICVPPEWCG